MHRATVINLSLGTAEVRHRDRLELAVLRARAGGAIVVAAHDDGGVRWLPGCLEGVVPVRADGSLDQLFGKTKTKYREVYSDKEIRVLEDTAAFPRAFVVPSALPLPAPMSTKTSPTGRTRASGTSCAGASARSPCCRKDRSPRRASRPPRQGSQKRVKSVPYG